MISQRCRIALIGVLGTFKEEYVDFLFDLGTYMFSFLNCDLIYCRPRICQYAPADTGFPPAQQIRLVNQHNSAKVD